ncbi:MAG TPA: PEP-CTERM sorting domain-containing protein [Telluria sp.]
MTSPARHVAVSAIAVAALLAPQLALADSVHIETSSLTFDTGWSQRPETLVSDVNGAATFSLVNAVDSLRYPNMWQYNSEYSGMFELSARAGYKVTGYTLSGGFTGLVHVGRSPDGSGRPGGADTSAGAWFSAQDAASGVYLSSSSYSASNLQGSGDFTFASGALDQTGAFHLSFDGYAYGWASPAIWTTYDPETGPTNNYAFSRAEIGLKSPLLLTVYTQAVPEPHAYALTLAGLALMAGMVRRRKRLARAPA